MIREAKHFDWGGGAASLAPLGAGPRSSSSSFNPVSSSFPKVAGYISSPPRLLSHLPSISRDLQPDFLHTLFHLLPPCHFGRPRFRFPFTSSIIAFFSMLSLSLLITVHVHTISLHSPLPFYPTHSSNPTSPSAFPSSFYSLISIHTLTSPWLLQFFSLSLKHHVSLPYSIADLTQLPGPSRENPGPGAEI